MEVCQLFGCLYGVDGVARKKEYSRLILAEMSQLILPDGFARVASRCSPHLPFPHWVPARRPRLAVELRPRVAGAGLRRHLHAARPGHAAERGGTPEGEQAAHRAEQSGETGGAER